jgi:LytS/YehU family sensor histidine kinase
MKLSGFLRPGLENQKFDTITVKEELAFCRDYITMQINAVWYRPSVFIRD